MKSFRSGRRFFPVLSAILALAGGMAGALLGVCGPFTDVSDAGFCPFVLEIFTLGITTGTSPTTYDPGSAVTRLQMAAFLSRTVDRALQRGSGRAALQQYWTPQNPAALGLTSLPGLNQRLVEFDGADVWVACGLEVARVRAGDGKFLETWAVPAGAYGVLSALGRIFVTSAGSSTNLHRIDPSQPAGAATTIATNLPTACGQLAFDGSRIWIGCSGGLVPIVTPGASLPWTVTTVTVAASGNGLLYDGSNIWATDNAGRIRKLDSNGAVLQTVTVGNSSALPVFDGTNIWVPGGTGLVSVVRASSGAVLATLTGNGLGTAFQAAFDGQRVMVTSSSGSLSLWKAADLTPLGFLSVPGMVPIGVASDGVNFWIAMTGPHQLARF